MTPASYRLVDGAEVWALHATHGLSLELSLPLLADRGMIPTWDRLLEAAQRDGAHLGRLVGRLQGAVGDAYPPTDAAIIRHRLGLLLERAHR